ncbi:MAG TPA: phosphoglucomutase/phosphomannomutase family protein [Dehalococcoidales bacterium]|nr:phosphoglucomutase/phosphomannomutase family protein [Dehalococcoidales bacterium]
MTDKPNPIKFGTDGWRAIIAENFTFDNVRYCAQGVADYLKHTGLDSRGIVIGYDTRFDSDEFAASAAEILAGNGIKVYLAPKPTPTPVISYSVLAYRAGGAIIITASHNPGIWNGFKYKDEHGSSAADNITSKIVGFIDKAYGTGKISRLAIDAAKKHGLAEETDLDPVYFEQVGKLVDLKKLRQAKLKLAIDPMFGAGAGYLKRLMEGGNLSLSEIHGERNPLFPGLRPEPIMPHLEGLAAEVKSQKAAVGLATDGDADRMGIVDEKGNFLTQLQVFALLCLYMLETRGQRGPIIKSLTTTNMAFRLGELFNVPVYQTAVGFKYIAPLMMEKNALIGGEESGGYGFRGHVAERDGVLANLFFLDLVVRTGKKPSELIDYLYKKVGPHYYNRIDITFPEAERANIIARVRDNPPSAIDGVKVANLDKTDGYRFNLADNSWLLIRFSGTEPLLRIYTETSSPERVARFLDAGKKMAGV